MLIPPALTILEPDGPARRTLIVLHGNDGSPGVMAPLYSDLTSIGWRVAVPCSGQAGPPGAFVWNDLDASSASLSQWAGQLGPAYWAGFSAGAYVALRGALQGHWPCLGLLAVVPSLPTHPAWWPQGWTEHPARVPVAFVVGEQDNLTPPAPTRAFAARLAGQGVRTRIWSHAGGHEHPAAWPDVRDEALSWLVKPPG